MNVNAADQMKDKTCLITGASSGIGEVTALALAEKGADLVLLCRNKQRGETSIEKIRQQSPTTKIDLLIADLASLKQVRNAAEQFLAMDRPLHLLLNNAGLMVSTRTETEDGFETTFGVNHIGHFLLTDLLLERIKQSAPARIVNVASLAHRMGKMDFDDLNSTRKYRGMRAYTQSKLANILFTHELAKRLEGTGVTVNSVDPGPVATNFGQNSPGLMAFLMRLGAPLMPNPVKGARTSIYVASSPDLEGVTGKYFSKSRQQVPSERARNDLDAQKLWRLSEQMLAS